MSTDVQGMLVRIEATTQQLRQELARAESAVGKATKQIDGNLARVDAAFDRVEQSAGDARAVVDSALSGIAASAVAGVAGIGALVSITAAAGKELTSLSFLANASAAEFQRMAAGARSVGVDQGKLADVLKDVNDRVGEFASTGGGEMKDFFEQIAPKVGVTVQQFQNLSGPQALQLYYDSLEKAGLNQQEMTFYMEAMADEATALIPLLANGGKGFQEMGDRAKRLGVVLSDLELSQLSELSKIAGDASAAWDGFTGQLVAGLHPAISALVESLDGEGFSDAAQNLGDGIRFVIENLDALAIAVGSLGAGKLAIRFVEGVQAVAGYAQAVRAAAVAERENAQAMKASALERVQLAEAERLAARVQVIATSGTKEQRVALNQLRQAKREVTAANAAYAAAQAASNTVTGTATALLRGALGLFGGPVGLVTMIGTAAAGWLLFSKNSDQANRSTIDLTKSVEEQRKEIEALNLAQANARLNNLQDEQRRWRDELAATTRTLEGQVGAFDKWGGNFSASQRERAAAWQEFTAALNRGEDVGQAAARLADMTGASEEMRTQIENAAAQLDEQRRSVEQNAAAQAMLESHVRSLTGATHENTIATGENTGSKGGNTDAAKDYLEQLQKQLNAMRDKTALQAAERFLTENSITVESELGQQILATARAKDRQREADSAASASRRTSIKAVRDEAKELQSLLDKLLPAEAAQREHVEAMKLLDQALLSGQKTLDGSVFGLEAYTKAVSAAWAAQNKVEWDRQNEQHKAAIATLDQLAERVARLGMDEFQVAGLDFSKLTPTPEQTAQFDAYIGKLREFQEAQKATAALDGYLSADFGADLAAGFDAAGQSMGQFVSSFGKLVDMQEQYGKAVKANSKDIKALSKLEAKNAKDQVNAYGNMAGAAKGFFREGSTGYKTLQDAEMAFRAVEMALAVESLAVKLGLMEAEVLAAMAKNAAITASSAIAAAVSSMVGLPFPLNLAALAATTAAIVAIAGSMFGGGGSSGSSGPTAAQVQASNNGKGLGTTLGDGAAGSESIAQSLDLLGERQDKLLRINNSMLGVLQSIDSGIRGYATQIFQFRELTGARVQGFRVPDVSFGALEALLPQLIDTQRPSGTLIQTQDPTRIVGRSTGKLDADLQAAEAFYAFFTASVTKVGDAFRTGAPLLGYAAEQVEEALSTASLGALNIKGLQRLKGDELAERLGNIVGAAGDRIAAQLDDSLGLGLRRFQQVGEGMSATMVRVSGAIEQAEAAALRLRVEAIDYTQVLAAQGDVATEIIRQSVLLRDATASIPGGVAEMVGAFQGSADEIVDFVFELRNLQDALTAAGQRASYLTAAMIQGAGGLDLLTDGLQSYFDDFLTPAEQASELMRRLGGDFGALGRVVPGSIEDFRRLVEGIDTTSEAGQRLYGSLIALAPAFSRALSALNAAVDSALDAQNAALEAALRGVDSASQEVSRAQSDLQRAIEASNKPISDGLRDMVGAFGNAVTALRGLAGQLDGLGQTSTQNLQRLRSEFDALSRRARLGDAEAGVEMAAVGKTLADAVLRGAGTATDARREIARIQREANEAAEVAERQKSLAEQQLEALTGIGESVMSVADATRNLAAAQAAQVTAQARYSELLAAALSEEQLRRKITLKSIIDALGKGTERLSQSLNGGFGQIDSNLDGLLTFDELRTALAGKATDDEIRNMIAALDANTDGVISAAEAGNARLGQILADLVKGATEGNTAAVAKALASGFASLDSSMDGLLSAAELTQALGPLARSLDISKVITELDTNGDGLISALELASKNEVAAVKAVEAAIRAQAAQVGGGVTENLGDAGKDVTLAEFKKAVQTAAAAKGISASVANDSFVSSLFNQMDTNLNGKIRQGGANNEYSQVAVENAIADLLRAQQAPTTPGQTPGPAPAKYTYDKARVADSLEAAIDAALGVSGFSPQSYLAKNPGVAGSWPGLASTTKGSYNNDPNLYGAWHYWNFGKKENRQFFTGGYTGPGGMLEEAGTVHKGEVVWNQFDVARFGGWQNVEALRLGGPLLDIPNLQLPNGRPQLNVAMPRRSGDGMTASLLAELGQLRATVEQQGYALVSMADNLADIKKSNRHLRDWARTGVPVQENVA